MRSLPTAALCLVTTVALAAGYTFWTNPYNSQYGITVTDDVLPSSADCTDEVTGWDVSITVPANHIDGGQDGEYDVEFVAEVYDRNNTLLDSFSWWPVRDQDDDVTLNHTEDILAYTGTDLSDLDGGGMIEVEIWGFAEPNDGELLGGSVFYVSTTSCN